MKNKQKSWEELRTDVRKYIREIAIKSPLTTEEKILMGIFQKKNYPYTTELEEKKLGFRDEKLPYTIYTEIKEPLIIENKRFYVEEKYRRNTHKNETKFKSCSNIMIN